MLAGQPQERIDIDVVEIELGDIGFGVGAGRRGAK